MQHYAHGPAVKKIQHGQSNPNTFEGLLKHFTPAIQRMARQYPSKWENDFFQEGSLALFDAMQKFAVLPPLSDFRPYAMQAIKSRMIDFFRTHIKRSPKTEDIHNPTVDTDFDGNTEFISNFTAEPEFFATPDFELDYKIIFAEETMKAHAFLAKEIEAFNFHTQLDLTVKEIAKRMQVSEGQASKLLSRAKAKSLQLWNAFNNYEIKHTNYGKE